MIATKHVVSLVLSMLSSYTSTDAAKMHLRGVTDDVDTSIIDFESKKKRITTNGEGSAITMSQPTLHRYP